MTWTRAIPRMERSGPIQDIVETELTGLADERMLEGRGKEERMTSRVGA